VISLFTAKFRQVSGAQLNFYPISTGKVKAAEA